MIAYFDTSSIVPLLVEEDGSAVAGRLWDDADRVLSVRLTYTEGHAALAQAMRVGRFDQRQLRRTVKGLLGVYGQLDLIELTDPLVLRAGELAELYALRGYDAVHLAAAELVNDDEMIFVSGDVRLCDAAALLGFHVAPT